METPQYTMINVLLTTQEEFHQISKKKILKLQVVWNEPAQTVQQYSQEKEYLRQWDNKEVTAA